MKLKDAVDRHAKDLESRSFAVEEVGRDERLTLELYQEFVVMSEHQFIQHFGGVRRVKDPKVPQVWLTSLGGEPELCYIFKHPDRPWRGLRVSSSIAEHKDTEMLKGSSHLHKEQSSLVLKHGFQQRCESSQLSQILSKNPCLSTVEEYAQKLDRRRERPPTGSADNEAVKGVGQDDGEAVFAEQQTVSVGEDEVDMLGVIKSWPSFETPTLEEKAKKKKKKEHDSADSRIVKSAMARSGSFTAEDLDLEGDDDRASGSTKLEQSSGAKKKRRRQRRHASVGSSLCHW